MSDAVAEPLAPELVPPSVVEMNPLTLVCGPAVVAVTLTVTVHDPFAGRLAPVVCPKLKLVEPAVGAHVGEPVHVVLAEGAAATCSPPGSVSVNFAPVSCTLFGLVSVKVSVDVPLTAMGFGENDLVSVGWRPRLLAASAHWLHGEQSEDASPASQAREALRLKG